MLNDAVMDMKAVFLVICTLLGKYMSTFTVGR